MRRPWLQQQSGDPRTLPDLQHFKEGIRARATLYPHRAPPSSVWAGVSARRPPRRRWRITEASVGEAVATTEGDFVTQGAAMDSTKADPLVSIVLVGAGLAQKGP